MWLKMHINLYSFLLYCVHSTDSGAGERIMTHGTDPVSRRSVLRKGGLTVTAVAVGVPAVTGSAEVIDPDPPEMIVDVPPTMSSGQRGQVVTAIYPGGDMDPEDVIGHEDHEGFKLGPLDTDVEENGAAAVRWRLLPTGNMGVFFDSSTANVWFDQGQGVAKLSAIDASANVIAWGDDEVTVR